MSEHPQYTMNSADILSIATQFMDPLSQLLSVEHHELKPLSHLLIYAAARNLSISCACKQLSKFPKHYEALDVLRNSASNLDRLTKHFNDLLANFIPVSFRSGYRKFAVDIVQIPFQGGVEEEYEHELCRSKAKGGTTKCFLYATICCLFKGRRYTVALTRCQDGETMDVILKRLVRRLSFLGLKMKLLLLDREIF